MKQIPEGIKNIIFDLGGVLLDLDVKRSIEAFQNLGLPDVIKPGGWDYHHEVFLQMEQGKLSEEKFRDGVRSLIPNFVSDEEIDRAWCAMLVDFAPEKITMLQQLQKQYRLYLFSNTNSIHIRYFHRLFMKKFGYSLSDLFVKDYYSSEIQLRKPTPESFQYVLNDAGMNPSETLFVDDSNTNIDGADSLGIHTFHARPEADLQAIFLVN